MFGLGAKELGIVLVIILVIFGPGRLPEIGRSLGKGLGEFKRSARNGGDMESSGEEKL
ncbi:twin-arginine translocase TatA/TatE family subunit [Halarsenatibacter silvermanii]|uniref:Sec-independent protein translocase protein TatA n=1 Tax=Halarsenatibacter silvermanii TaxID=321763 RepID=A0A1G9MX36_9FIRM|nr:twin-arginine translocase TatA/TatE family subunit [Halarsenatibacter silvermanii]SDL78856.1 sec-independent protein translocase protein TatA [Halarsenatibacter silvermanii]